jgi:hypothetical protein
MDTGTAPFRYRVKTRLRRTLEGNSRMKGCMRYCTDSIWAAAGAPPCRQAHTLGIHLATSSSDYHQFGGCCAHGPRVQSVCPSWPLLISGLARLTCSRSNSERASDSFCATSDFTVAGSCLGSPTSTTLQRADGVTEPMYGAFIRAHCSTPPRTECQHSMYILHVADARQCTLVQVKMRRHALTACSRRRRPADWPAPWPAPPHR